MFNYIVMMMIKKLTKKVVTVPAEFPGTSLICISIRPKRYWFFDWKPEPEYLSRESERRLPLLRNLPRPSPQLISKSRSMPSPMAKLTKDENVKEIKKTKTNGEVVEVIVGGLV